jgi:hypothetical protein
VITIDRGKVRMLATGVAAAALAVPTAAAAAERPAATTLAASNVAQTTASLNGTVDPNGAATTYFFEFGATRAYGGRTAAASAGAGGKAVRVTVPVAGFAPATTYHFRLVAQNAKGVRRGADRTLKTKRQPLGVSLAATPNPIRASGSTTLAGTLTGTGNGDRQVVLQANPWPYSQGFLSVANIQLTDASGNFSFPILSVPVNTQYRVVMPQKPEVVSPVVVLGTTVRVTTHVHVKRGHRRGRVHFYGSLMPPADGTQLIIQKYRHGDWRNIASTVARHRSSKRSRYSKYIRERQPGRYRVYHAAVEPRVPNVGRTVRVRHVRR